MYKLAILSLCFFSTTFSLNAQEIYAEIKLNQYYGEIEFDPELNVDGTSKVDNHAKNYSLAVTAQITEHFFIKTSISSNDFRRLLRVNWNEGGNAYRFFGAFSADQKVIEFLPEIRLFKNNFLFLNAGIGVTGLKNGRFSNGSATINDNDWEIEEFEGYYQHFAANLGVNIQFGVVGLIAEAGYKNSGKLESATNPFQMRFVQFGMKVGVSYRLRDVKEKIVKLDRNYQF